MAVDLRQTHFRFGYDNGTEITHGFIAAEDVNPTAGLIIPGMRFLLRICEQEAGGTAVSDVAAQLQYKLNTGSWVDVTTSSSVVKAVNVIAFAAPAHCTQRLSGTGTFESSAYGCSENGLSGGTANDIVASGNSETEYGLQLVPADVVPGDVIYFQITSPQATISYDVFPAITIAATYELTAQGTQAASTANPVTMTFDCAGGDLLVLKVFTLSAVRGGAVPTFNSVDMTDSGQGKVSSGGEARVELFYLASPSSGSQTISIPNTGVASISLIVSAWSGIDTTDPFDTSNSALNAGSANPACAITTGGAGKLIVDAMMDGLLTLPIANSHIQISGTDLGAYTISSQFCLADGSAGITLSYTVASDDWAMIVISFNPTPTGTTYYGYITQTLTLTPAISRRVTFDRRILQTLTLTPAISRRLTYLRGITQTLTLTPAVTRMVTFLRGITQTLTLTPSIVGAVIIMYFGNITCALTLTPDIARRVTFARSISQTITLTPGITRRVTFLRGITQTLTLTPALSRVVTYLRGITGSLTLTPLISRRVTFLRGITQTITLTPAITRTVTFLRGIAVTLTLTPSIIGALVTVGTMYYATINCVLTLTASISDRINFSSAYARVVSLAVAAKTLVKSITAKTITESITEKDIEVD